MKAIDATEDGIKAIGEEQSLALRRDSGQYGANFMAYTSRLQYETRGVDLRIVHIPKYFDKTALKSDLHHPVQSGSFRIQVQWFKWSQ